MEEHKFLRFLSKHWAKLLLIVLAVASLAAWGERWFASHRSQSQQDFLVGSQILERFRKGEPLAMESIEAAENILERHPELHPKYDAMLAMTYFAQRNPSRGLSYAKTALEHASSALASPYKAYATATLLIAEKNYQEAYQEAQNLYTQLRDNATYSVLRGMNLLRLVSLERELDIQSNAWEELKAHPTFSALSPLFQEGTLSLEDWHSLRLKN